MENENSAESVQQKMEKKSGEHLRKTKTEFDGRVNSIIAKQKEIPAEIKNALSKAPPKQPVYSMEKVLKEVLTQQKRKKEDMEKRGNNLVL